MKGILIVSGECPPCEDLRAKFADLISSGEIEEKSLEKNEEEVINLMKKYEVNIPSLLIVTDSGEMITLIQDEEGETSPAKAT